MVLRTTTRLALTGMVLAALLGSAPSQASPTRAEFIKPPAINSNVAFWKNVYITWSVNQIAIHDDEDLGLVYNVVRVPARGAKGADGLGRKETIDKATRDVSAALKALQQKQPKDASKLSGVEKTVFENLQGVKRADKYGRTAHLRAQNGLRERFLQGYANSGLFEEFIRAELRRNGLPEELIGVAFVESLFSMGAKSKVGAAGVWQFMSYTGKEYMHLNAVVDERWDPILATEAACKYLKQAKKMLDTWPLAVTSYNYGKAGMKALKNGAGTADFGVILAVSKNKRFGFAARNYYASFLAVVEILDERQKYLAGVQRKPAWSYDVIRAPFPLYASQLLGTKHVDEATFNWLNPALTTEASASKVPLPHGISLRVPKGKGGAVVAALQALPERERQRAQRAVRTVHKADGKGSVKDIAKKYGMRADIVAAVTGLDVDVIPARGQQIPIPASQAGYTLFPEARSMAVPPLPPPVPILLAEATVTETVDGPDPAPTQVAAASAKPDKPKPPKVEPLRVRVSDIEITTLHQPLPAVDLVAGGAPLFLPDVDVIAGDPGPDAPWLSPPVAAAPAPPTS